MEKSESGSPIYRYENYKPKGFKVAPEPSSLEEITNHIEKHVGKIETVFHEIVSDKVHIDVHWVEPSKKRPFHTLITSGMSDLPMTTPEGVLNAEFAELSICLPEDWKISMEDFENDEYYWPIRLLKSLARFPHEFDTWLGWGHTLPNGNPPESYAYNTKMNTALLLPSIIFDEEFHELKIENKTINFFTVIPLHQGEVDLKMTKGVEALFSGFDKTKVSDILNVSRDDSSKRRKRFGLF